MALIQTSLSNSLSSLFSDPPDTFLLCARKWAESMRDYTLTVVPPTTTTVAASELLATTLFSVFQASSSAATTAAAMEAAFAVYAVTVGAGMSPSFVATPPAGLVGFSSLFSSTPFTHAEAASNFAQSIHIWMSTGLAVPVPAGPSVPWT